MIASQGQNDLGTITQRSFGGWYWGAPPAIAVGLFIRWIALGAIHVSERPKQAKKPLLHTLGSNVLGYLVVLLYIVILLGLFGAISYLLLRETSSITDG